MSKPKPKAPSRDPHRRSRSRNSTPMSAGSLSAVEPIPQPYLTTPLKSVHVLSETPVCDLFDANSAVSPPTASALRSITDNVRSQLLSTTKTRGEVCERFMRELSSKRKERAERKRRREQEEREAEERKKTAAVTSNPKKRAREDESRPLAVGAHGLARQDGEPKAASSSSASSPISQPPKTPTEAKQEPGSPMSDSEPHQPPPAPAIQQYQIFGTDPTEYPDDTIYEILPITPGMTDDEKRAIYCVAHFPESDLHDQTAGTAPDRDLSNAKPAQQINFSTFQNYAEPFLKPLTEEDRGFLLERGDRERPFVIPKLGMRHYREMWDEEDGKMVLDPNAGKLPANEARGSLEDMDDDVAESDQLSLGPTLSRLLSTMRSEYQFRANGKEEEVKLPGIDNMEVDGEVNGHSEEEPKPPAAQFPDLYWKGTPTTRPDHSTIDERILRELKFLGLVGPHETPDYTASEDDQVAARLRYLQNELRRVSIKNGARKQRLLELTEDWMSKLEYSNIADDLDNQINQAYLKRNRTVGKKKQTKKPGGPGGGSHSAGVARAAGAGVGINEPIRGLIERKTRWKEWIGPVVDYGKTSIPEESIFGEELMKAYEAREQDTFGEEVEG